MSTVNPSGAKQCSGAKWMMKISFPPSSQDTACAASARSEVLGARAWHLRGPPQGTETKGASIAAGSRPGVPGAFFSAFSLDQAFPVPAAPSAFRAR